MLLPFIFSESYCLPFPLLAKHMRQSELAVNAAIVCNSSADAADEHRAFEAGVRYRLIVRDVPNIVDKTPK